MTLDAVKYNSAEELLIRTVREVWTPPPDVTVSEWAERYREVDAKTSARSGRWKNSTTPYLRGIMDAFNDPKIREISIIKFSQGGLTEALTNMLCYIVDVAPAPTLWVYPDLEIAREVNEKRLRPALEGSPRTARHFTERWRDCTRSQLDLKRMSVTFFGSNSAAKIDTFPFKYVFIDEFDRCRHGTLGKAIARTRTFPGYKIIKCGTPDLAGAGIHAEVYGAPGGEGKRGSDRRSFWVPCPRCGEFHVRDFTMVKWEGGSRADSSVVARTAWMRCPFCEKRIEAYDNRWQQERGRWAREGEIVNREGEIEGEAVQPDSDHAGFILRGVDGSLEANPYGYVARGFVDARGNPDREWVNRILGEAWTARGESVQEHDLKKLCTLVEFGGHKLRTVPRECKVLTMGADVQANRCYVIIRGWGAFGQTSWLIDAFELRCPTGSDCVELDHLMGKFYPFAGQDPRAPRQHGLRVNYGFVDSGHRTKEVYTWAHRMSERWVKGRAFPTKGRFSHAMTKPWQITALPARYNEKGEELPAVNLLLVNTETWKTAILGHIRAGVGALLGGVTDEMAGAGTAVGGLSGPAVTGGWRWPEDTSDEYFRQLTAEHRVRHLVRGKHVYSWEVRPGQGDGNHFFDVEVLTAAGADACGVTGLNGVIGAAVLDVEGQVAAPAAATPRAAAPSEGGRRRTGEGGGWLSGCVDE